MPATQLLELAKSGDLAGLESRCLEGLTAGQIGLPELAQAFHLLERSSNGPRVATIGQLVLDNIDADANPEAALTIARIALFGEPNHADLRKRVAGLYRAVHGSSPGFDALLEASGLESNRPARNAVRLLHLCLTLQKGEALISRTEDVVVEVSDVDHEGNLYTVRRDGRPRTIPALELAREYERIDPDDFRVLRQLRPKKLAELIERDPVAIVIGLIRVHGGQLDNDTLKTELVPRSISEKEWPKWWTNVRALLKKDPHVAVEGRAPIIMTYNATAQTAEDDAWAAFQAQNEPNKWLATVESYLREKKRDKGEPDPAFLGKCRSHLLNYIKSIEARRPAEALACALVTERLDQETGQNEAESRELAVAMLRRSDNPAALIAALPDNALWDLALSALESARPDDVAAQAASLFLLAPAGLLDDIIKLARKGSLLPQIQTQIDNALSDPVMNSEAIYWLWKGSSQLDGLTVPPPVEVFTRIIQTLSALGRTLSKPLEATKRFRARIKAALQLRDFAQVRAVMQQTPSDRAITLKSQLQRLDGLGDNTPSKMLELLRAVHPELWRVVETRLEPWEDTGVLWSTRAGMARKTEERDTLVNVTMRDNARRIGEAAQLGDLSENSEYKFALEERDLLRARLAQMNNDLSVAQMIEPDDVPTTHVGIGSRVHLKSAVDGAVRVVTFLGPFDGDVDRDFYNYKAPVAQRIMGLRVGEHAKIAFEGKEIDYEVVQIENGLRN